MNATCTLPWAVIGAGSGVIVSPNIAAIVDRLTFAGQIIETGTTSYRLTQARAARKSQPRH